MFVCLAYSVIHVTWLIQIWDMSHSYVEQDDTLSHVPHVNESCPTCERVMSHMWMSHEQDDTFICAPWLLHMWDMTHSYVRYDSFTCAPWFLHICAMTQLHTYSCTYTIWAGRSRQAWLICMCAMTHIQVRHDPFTCAMTHLRTYSCISYTYTAPYIDM